MMVKLQHIVTGWFHSLIWASASTKAMSRERLKECNSCDDAVESSVLKIIKGDFVEEACKKCRFCGCPIVEKSLVKQEKCPKGMWKQHYAQTRWLMALKKRLTKSKTL